MLRVSAHRIRQLRASRRVQAAMPACTRVRLQLTQLQLCCSQSISRVQRRILHRGLWLRVSMRAAAMALLTRWWKRSRQGARPGTGTCAGVAGEGGEPAGKYRVTTMKRVFAALIWTENITTPFTCLLLCLARVKPAARALGKAALASSHRNALLLHSCRELPGTARWHARCTRRLN